MTDKLVRDADIEITPLEGVFALEARIKLRFPDVFGSLPTPVHLPGLEPTGSNYDFDDPEALRSLRRAGGGGLAADIGSDDEGEQDTPDWDNLYAHVGDRLEGQDLGEKLLRRGDDSPPTRPMDVPVLSPESPQAFEQGLGGESLRTSPVEAREGATSPALRGDEGAERGGRTTIGARLGPGGRVRPQTALSRHSEQSTKDEYGYSASYSLRSRQARIALLERQAAALGLPAGHKEGEVTEDPGGFGVGAASFDAALNNPGAASQHAEKRGTVQAATEAYWATVSTRSRHYVANMASLAERIERALAKLFRLANVLGGGVALCEKEYVDFNVSLFRVLVPGVGEPKEMRRYALGDWGPDSQLDPGRYSNGGGRLSLEGFRGSMERLAAVWLGPKQGQDNAPETHVEGYAVLLEAVVEAIQELEELPPPAVASKSATWQRKKYRGHELWKGGKRGALDGIYPPEERVGGRLGEMGATLLDHKKMYHHCLHKAHLRPLLKNMGYLKQ